MLSVTGKYSDFLIFEVSCHTEHLTFQWQSDVTNILVSFRLQFWTHYFLGYQYNSLMISHYLLREMRKVREEFACFQRRMEPDREHLFDVCNGMEEFNQLEQKLANEEFRKAVVCININTTLVHGQKHIYKIENLKIGKSYN